MRRIDQLLDEASRSSHSRELRAKFGRQAIEELAPLLAVAPRDAELHYLAALGWMAVASAQGPASDGHPEPVAARRAHEEFAAVERFDSDGGRAEDVCVERAILESKEGRLEEALADYRRALLIEAAAGPYVAGDPLELHRGRAALLHGNAADTEMALGRVEEAILSYRRALDVMPKDSATLGSMPHWGLAVALDRDRQLERSRAEVKAALARDPEMRDLDDAVVFFVPPGERFYYQALGLLARGQNAPAAEALRKFLATGPLPRFAERARRQLASIGHAGKPATSIEHQ